MYDYRPEMMSPRDDAQQTELSFKKGDVMTILSEEVRGREKKTGKWERNKKERRGAIEERERKLRVGPVKG